MNPVNAVTNDGQTGLDRPSAHYRPPVVEVQSVLEHADTDEETFRKDICFIVSFMLPLQSKMKSIMATYTITVNERTHGGRALMAYLKELGVLVEKQISTKKSSYARSKEDIRKGQVESFESAEDMFKSLGI